MANKTCITAEYEKLPFWARLLIQIFAGIAVGGVFRIVRYFETKNITTLVVGLLATFTGVGNFISWVVDLYILVRDKKYTLYVD